MRGTLTDPNNPAGAGFAEEAPASTTAASVNGCAAFCLSVWDCALSEYNVDTGECHYYFDDANNDGFEPDATSDLEYSDMQCFVAC